MAQASSPRPGQRGEQPGQEGQQRGNQQQGNQQEGARGQLQQAQAQRGQGQGQGQGEGQQPGENNQEGGGEQQQARANEQQGGGGQRGNFFENFNPGGNENGGGVRGGPNGGERPITGEEFRNWADRLRDVQDMLDEPNLRNDLNRVLDRAREMRSDFKRHSKAPEWNLLQTQLLNPLVEIRQRVAEELARRNASTVAPLDRDPVPGRYSELVSRYYQSLGEGGSVPEDKKPAAQ